MEYCDKGDLAKLLLNHRLSNNMHPGPFPEKKIWKYFLQMCVGLNYIHKSKILHRDIKTMNIFITQDDDIRIGDLGVAKILSHTANFAHTMVGTPFYLSPQLCEEKPYNNKSDVWALGCVLYEMCTLRHPFDAVNQGALILKIIRGKYAPIPAAYSKTLKDIVDQCLLKDYKRRPSIHDILAVPEVVIKLQELGVENKEEQIDPKLLMKAKSPPIRREVIKSKAEISARANVSEVKRAHQLKQQEELNKYNDVLKRPPAYQRPPEVKKENNKPPDFQEFLAQRKQQQQASTPSQKSENEKKKPSSSPFSFIPKDISEFARNAARKAVDKVSNLIKPEAPPKSPLPNPESQLPAHRRNNSDLAPNNIYKPVLRSPKPVSNFENFKKDFTPSQEDLKVPQPPPSQRRLNSRGFIGYNNPVQKQKQEQVSNSMLDLNMGIQGQKVDLQKRQPVATPVKRKSDFLNKQEFKDRSAEVKKPTISMLKNGPTPSRNAPTRVQSEGNFRMKIDTNEKNNLVKFDPQIRKDASNKRLEEELKKRLVPQPLPAQPKKDAMKAKIEKKNKKKLTVQDLEDINDVKNLPDNPRASQKEDRKKWKKKEEEEDQHLSKMVRDFIEKGQQPKRETKPKVEQEEKEESKSLNSSFDQVNEREEESSNQGEGNHNLAKLKSLATIKEESLRFQDHEESKPVPLMTYMSDSKSSVEYEKKLQSGEIAREKAEEVDSDEIDESTAGIEDEKDSDEESFYESNKKPFIRFNRSQIKVPEEAKQEESRANFSSMLAVPQSEESPSNRLSNLKFKKTGQNSIPVIQHEEYQTQKLEVVNIMEGEDDENSDQEEEKEVMVTAGADEGDELLQSLVFDVIKDQIQHIPGNEGFCAEDSDSELEEEIDEDCNIIDEVQDFKEENYCIVEPDELFEQSEDETTDTSQPRDRVAAKLDQLNRDIEKKRKRINELYSQGRAGLGDKFQQNLNFFKMKAQCELTRKDEEDIGKMMHSDAHLSEQIEILYKIVNFEIQLDEMEKQAQESQQQLINLGR